MTDASTPVERFEVQRQIAAPPATVFAVLRDPKGHVAIDASGMLMSADGNPAEQAGDQFVMHMDRESLNDQPLGKYDVAVIITQYEQDQLIEWKVAGITSGRPSINHLYGYRLEPSDIGTLATSYYDWSQISDEFRQRDVFPIIPEATLRASLGILARTVE